MRVIQQGKQGRGLLSELLRAASSDRPLLATSAYRRLLRFFLGYVSVMTLVYGLLTLRFYRSWTTADWLINYAGGFVRRGLPGQIALELGRACHVSPIFFVALILLAAYAVLLATVRRLAWSAWPSWWCLALLVSPATLSFQILDATGGFRKEVLFLAMLASVLAFPVRESLPRLLIVLMGTLAVAALVLSHETLICFTPYLAAAVCLRGKRLRETMILCALPLATGLALSLYSLQRLGDVTTARSICASLGYPLLAQGKAICAGGAIGYLAYTPAMARVQTWAAVRGELYFIVYPLASALALLPLVGGSVALSGRGVGREVRLVWGAAALSFCMSLPLFVYAEDWGRWIYVHILSVAFLMLSLANMPAEHAGHRVEMSEGGKHRGAWWALATYATLWSLPHVPSRTLPFGYLGLLHFIGLHL